MSNFGESLLFTRTQKKKNWNNLGDLFSETSKPTNDELSGS